jgi:hypothetical protein
MVMDQRYSAFTCLTRCPRSLPAKAVQAVRMVAEIARQLVPGGAMPAMGDTVGIGDKREARHRQRIDRARWRTAEQVHAVRRAPQQ